MEAPTSPYPGARLVLGEGPIECDLMFVGEAPGADEDEAGRPFVGRSGKFLTKLISFFLARERGSYYVTNVAKHRPPDNRAPTPDEVKHYLPYLIAEVERVNPAVVVTLGATAGRVFLSDLRLKRDAGVAKRATLGAWSGIVVPWFHPAFALRAPGMRGTVTAHAAQFWAEVARVKIVPTSVDYRLVSGAEMRVYLEGAAVFAFDFETTDNEWNGVFSQRRSKPIGFSASRAVGEARYTTDSIICIKDLLEDTSVRKIAHNAQFEYSVSRNNGIDVQNLDDTKLMAYVLRKQSTGLKDLSRSELGIAQTRFEEVDWTDQAAVTAYGCADSDLTLRLDALLTDELKREGLWDVYEKIERPLPGILSRMHARGIPLDVTILAGLEKKLDVELLECDKQLTELYPYAVNWDSAEQRREVLYGPKHWRIERERELKGRVKHDEQCPRRVKLSDCDCHGNVRTGAATILAYIPPGLALPTQYVEGSEAASTGIAALRSLRRAVGETPIAEVLEKRASIQQALRLNVRGLPTAVQEDGRIHSTFIQGGGHEEQDAEGSPAPETGRLASRGPNVQNITHHGDTERPYIVEWAREIRRAFYAPEGWTWVKVDAAREEPWIGYVVSGDEQWKHDLTVGDVYKTAASFAYGIDVKVVDKEQRQIGKRMAMAWLNRARSYGIRKSAHWLKAVEAEAWCEKMDGAYARFTAWHRELVAELYRTGYVSTYFGRRCPLPHIWMGPTRVQQKAGRRKTAEQDAAERECVPMVIQGTGGDLIKLALARVDSQLDDAWAAIISTIHDELNLLVRHEKVDYACRNILSHMFDGMLPIPIIAEITTGPNWATQVEWHA